MSFRLSLQKLIAILVQTANEFRLIGFSDLRSYVRAYQSSRSLKMVLLHVKVLLCILCCAALRVHVHV
jgi:hypothetical protein